MFNVHRENRPRPDFIGLRAGEIFDDACSGGERDVEARAQSLLLIERSESASDLDPMAAIFESDGDGESAPQSRSVRRTGRQTSGAEADHQILGAGMAERALQLTHEAMIERSRALGQLLFENAARDRYGAAAH